MGRGTGAGLIGLGVVLAVVGAVMRYAIEAQPTGFDVVTAGGILLLVGVVSILVGLLLVVMGTSLAPPVDAVDAHGRARDRGLRVPTRHRIRRGGWFSWRPRDVSWP